MKQTRSSRTDEEKIAVKEYDRIRKKEKYSLLNPEEKSEYIKNQKENINKRKRWQQETASAVTRFANFKKETKDGPSFVCVCCHRLLFKKGVHELNPKKIILLFNNCDPALILKATNQKITIEMQDEAVKENQGIMHQTQEEKINKEILYMCCNCFSTLTRKKKCPRISVSNGLELDEQPECLTDLKDLELQLISLELIFLKIFRKPPSEILKRGSSMRFVHDHLINVPLEDEDIIKTINSLPRNLDESGMVLVNLKRMKCLKKNELSEWVRPDKMKAALTYLRNINMHYKNIIWNEDFSYGSYEDSTEDEEVYENLLAFEQDVQKLVAKWENFSHEIQDIIAENKCHLKQYNVLKKNYKKFFESWQSFHVLLDDFGIENELSKGKSKKESIINLVNVYVDKADKFLINLNKVKKIATKDQATNLNINEESEEYETDHDEEDEINILGNVMEHQSNQCYSTYMIDKNPEELMVENLTKDVMRKKKHSKAKPFILAPGEHYSVDLN